MAKSPVEESAEEFKWIDDQVIGLIEACLDAKGSAAFSVAAEALTMHIHELRLENPQICLPDLMHDMLDSLDHIFLDISKQSCALARFMIDGLEKNDAPDDGPISSKSN